MVNSPIPYDASYEPLEEEEAESKEAQPLNKSNLATPDSGKVIANGVTASQSTEYSTPSVLSSSVPAITGTSSSVDTPVPEPEADGDEEKACATSSKQTLRHRSRRNQIIIDYRSIEMEAKHICSKCGAVLSDAQIMVGWCSEFKAVSATFPCLMCRSNPFAPKLHVRYHITRLSDDSGICKFEVMDKMIEYISPLQLRTKVNRILSLNRLDFEDPEQFRAAHEEEFWNMLWYFYHRQLDMSFMLGEQDANSLSIRPIGGAQQRRAMSGRKLLYSDFEQKDDPNISPSPEPTPDPPELPPPMVLEPQSDLELLGKLKPIYELAVQVR